MILLISVFLGLSFGWVRAKYNGEKLTVPILKLEWLVWVGFLPQFLAFYYNPTRQNIDDSLASVLLVASQILLLFFIWNNLQQSGFWIFGLGLLMNLFVILFNNGLMPIAPEMVELLRPDAAHGSWEIGARLGFGKDIVLPIAKTRLAWLSDRFFLPAGLFAPTAFSIGDVFIASGVFLFLWAQGKRARPSQ